MVLSISAGELADQHSHALIEAFDLSQDGEQLAVAFESVDAQRRFSIWVGQWEVNTKKLIAKQQVDGPSALSGLLPNAQYRLDVQFIPGKRGVIVQTGLRIKTLNPETLVPVGSIAAPERPPGNHHQMGIRRFAVSADGQWIAVLSNVPTYDCQATNVRVYSIATGAQVADWTMDHTCAKSMALSPTGDRILLSRIDSEASADADVLIVESRTGHVIGTVDAGYGGHGPLYGANDARFIDGDRFVTLSTYSVWSPSSLALHTLKIWDARTGHLLRQLRYSKFGIVGDSLAVAPDAKIIAAVTNKGDPSTVMRDDSSNTSRPHLLLFRLDDEEPFYVSPALQPHGTMDSPQTFTSPVRISATGRDVGIIEDGAVKVFRIPQ